MINNSVVITEYQNKMLSFLEESGHMEYLSVSDKENDLVGNIYVGRVKNLVKNLNACFVEIAPGTIGFLSFADVIGEEQLRAGDLICVQILKAASKNKEIMLTMKLSLQGFLVVVERGNGKVNISRNIKGDKRSFFKEALKGYSANNVIVRSNAAECEGIGLLREEISKLSDKLDEIIRISKSRVAFSELFCSSPDYMHFIQGLKSDSYDRVISDIPAVKDSLFDCSLYEDEYPLIKLYSIESKIDSLLSKTVYLKSGGNIVIEYTEALTVIDVNSGKNISKKEKAEYVFNTNLEAASEIARQIRLRNLSGMILVDFINMETEEHISGLISQLKICLSKDNLRCEYVDYTKLGLVEIVRNKSKPPIYEMFLKSEEYKKQ